MRLKFKDYRRIFLKYGIVSATIPIIISEITWDCIVNAIGLSGIIRELIESFFRAALLEELFKFRGFMKANKDYQFENEKEYMLGAGAIGLAYGVVEKVVTGNPFNMLLGILFPMHTLWQMNQGSHYYKYHEAKKNNDMKKSKHEFFMATFLVFMMHGCWDAILSLSSYFGEETSKYSNDTLSAILFVTLIIFGIIYIVKSVKKIKKVLKDSNQIEEVKGGE